MTTAAHAPHTSDGDRPAATDARARPLNVLLLCDAEPGVAATILDHVNALRDYSRHRVFALSFMRNLPDRVDLERFDALVIHYSLVASFESNIDAASKRRIREFTGLKAAFVQDEYRFIDATVAALRDLDIHALFTCVPPGLRDVVYPEETLPGVVKETVLTGYVPLELAKRRVPAYPSRPIDIGYRARKLAPWLGRFATEKYLIAERVLADASKYSLQCDISVREEDRLYGRDWIRFLSRCKAVLGTESGASVLDFTGDIQRAVEAHLARAPGTAFAEMRRLYFADHDERHTIAVISPRIFEAAALRTLLVLYEGSYSGRLVAWEHYVPLRKDHSNMDEVVAVIRDPARAQQIIDRAYTEVALDPRNAFPAMVSQFDALMATRFVPTMAARRAPYAKAEFGRLAWRTRWDRRYRKARYETVRRVVGVIDAGLRALPTAVEAPIRQALRFCGRQLLGTSETLQP